jgi:hypothetical protein
MKRIVLLVLSLVRRGIGRFGAQILGPGASVPGGEIEPPRCLMDAMIEVTANPSTVNLGESSVVSWSVRLPDGCGGPHVTVQRAIRRPKR